MALRGPTLVQRSSGYIQPPKEKKGASAGAKIAASLKLLEKGLSITDKHKEKQLSYSGLLTDEQFQFMGKNQLGDDDLFNMFERVPVDDPGMIPNPITYFQEATAPISHRIRPTQRALNHPDIGHEGVMEALNKADKFNKKDISNIVYKKDYSEAFEFTPQGKVKDRYPHRDVDIGSQPEESFEVKSIKPTDEQLQFMEDAPTLDDTRKGLGGTDKYGFSPNTKTEYKPLGYQPDVNNQEILDTLDNLGSSFKENVSAPVGDTLDKINAKGTEFVDKGKDAIVGKLGEETAKNMGNFAKSVGKVAGVASQAYGGYRVAKGLGKGDAEEVIQGAIQLATPALIAAGPVGWAVLGASMLEDLLFD